MYSSSVTDIFTSFYSALDFMEKFQNGTGKKNSKLDRKFIKVFTALSFFFLTLSFYQALCKALQEYAEKMFTEFKNIAESPDILQFSSQVTN